MNVGLQVFCCILSFFVLILPVASIIIGKVRLKRALKPIDYYPPRGYSPIDVMIKYYGSHAKAHGLINPIMLYWASRGFITIEEDCKRGLKLTKLKDLKPPKHIIDADITAQENYEIELKYFNLLFGSGDVFYTLTADSSYNKTNNAFIKDCGTSARGARTKLTTGLSYLSMISAFIVAAINTLTVGLSTGSGSLMLMSIFPLVGMIAFRAIGNFDDDIAAIIKYPFFIIWGGVPLVVLLTMIGGSAAAVLGVSMATSAFVIDFLAERIDIRSQADIEVYGKICAFKTFLLHAERDRVETLIEDNPDYYYDILPYCYVLKITDKLMAVFDRITLDGPSWYLGDLRNTLMF